MVMQITGICEPSPRLTGNEVGIATVLAVPGNGGVVPDPLGHPVPPDCPDQQQSILSIGRPPSGTVRPSASSWITPSVKSDSPISGAVDKLPLPLVATHPVKATGLLDVEPQLMMASPAGEVVVVVTVKPPVNPVKPAVELT